MCGRYHLSQEDCEEIEKIISEVNGQNAALPIKTGEIFPTDTAPVLTFSQGQVKAVRAEWGFAADGKNSRIINARAETVTEKKLFAQEFKALRCVVPSSGFFEWSHFGVKQKYLFRLPGLSALYMAGLMQLSGEGERRFTVLTAAANESMAAVHNRMPVILPSGRIDDWLTDAGFAAAYLKEKPPTLYLAPCENEQLGFLF